MEISKESSGEYERLTVTGRLDAYGADRLAKTLKEAVTHGARHLRLDFSELAFVSSAGLRVLLQFYKQLKGLHGSLAITDCSAPVKMVIALAGFEQLLGAHSSSSAAPLAEAAGAISAAGGERVERGPATYEKFELDWGASLACQLIGHPERPPQTPTQTAECRTMQFPAGTFALGIGAFGQEAADCRDRFGEFLAVAGAVAYHPTDGTDVPDYLLQYGAFLPEVQVLACLLGEGGFSHRIRFEAHPDQGAVSLDRLVEACLELTHRDAAGIVILAEAACIVGSVLTRSPLDGAGEETGRAARRFPRSTVLVGGVAAPDDRPALEGLLRPLGRHAWPIGWFHAAVFSFCPLSLKQMDLRDAVNALFESERLQGLVQLTGGPSHAAEPEPSEFVRGICWVGPLGPIHSERGGR